jgi:methionyl-tRNA synthetase
MYSPTDGRYLPDRYIEGTCPNCGFESARGDQCDNCTKQLDPVDLIDPRSVISGATDLEMRETKHLYLRQSAMKDTLETWIDTREGWPVLTTSIAKKWLTDGDGLQDRGITRDLDWGIPVQRGDEPWPGMEGKVFYVWFDAPIEYIACAQEWVDAGKGPAPAPGADKDSVWQRWWRTDAGADDVRYTQFMGKDNVPFHTLSFPATIMGVNGAEGAADPGQGPWKLVDYIKSFNYLNYDGGQFSTSRGRGVFMDQALEILPADYWRWWLLSHAPENSDAEFTWENFQTSVNKDLADVLGNFASRVTKFCRSKFGEEVPEGGTPGALEQRLIADLTAKLREYDAHMEAIEIRKAASALRAAWVLGNEYLQEAAPWATFKTDPDQAAMQIRLALNLIRLYAIVSQPFIPDACAQLREAMATDDTWPDDVAAALEALTPGHAFTVPDVTFRKITDAEREDWQARFAGTRA